MRTLADVLSDIDGATRLLADAVQAQASGLTFQVGEGLYREWRGDLVALARTVWRDLPLARTHPDVIDVMSALVPALRDSGILALHARPDTWRVRVDAPPPHADPEPHMKTYTCDDCSYTDISERSVSTHASRLAKPHPQDDDAPFSCPAYGDCPVQLPTVQALITHVRNKHTAQFAGRSICKVTTCLQWFPGVKELDRHSQDVHGTSVIHRRSKADSGPSAPRPSEAENEPSSQPEPHEQAGVHEPDPLPLPDTDPVPEPQPEPAQSPQLEAGKQPAREPEAEAPAQLHQDPGDLEHLTNGVHFLVEDYRRLCAEREQHRESDARIAALAAENETLRGQLAIIRQTLGMPVSV